MVEIIGENKSKLERSGKFQQWLDEFDKKTARVKTIEEGWSLWKGKNGDELIFALLFVKCLDENGREKGDVVFFRSDAAAVFLVIKDKDTGKKYVVLVEQLRIPSGGKLLEIPAGSVEEHGGFKGTIVREVGEEVGLSIPAEDFIFLGWHYPSPGACNEKIALYYSESVLSGADIKKLEGKLTGTPGEYTKVRIYFLEDFEKLGIHDGKTLLAYELYLRKGAK
ncbi:MAG: NUDIX domain-containing protein [Candidatus Nealsonbacteria bacterium]|nr:NUDIX domain-containing protein [Candidatus Nealsonbacteria bacterium]